jgi:hypothetical protein
MNPLTHTSIYVRKRCDIISECRDRLQYLEKKLNIKYDKMKKELKIDTISSAEEILDNSAAG